MTNDEWLRRGVLGSMALALASALALIVALVLGWNSPRPTHPPDWQAPDLPLRLEANSNDTVVALLGHPGSDFTLEIEATPVSGPGSSFDGYGLVYRAQNPAHYYVFAAGSDGYYAVLRIAEGEETTLVEWQQFPHVRRGQQANRLRVACAGGICHFYINDEYAATVEDDTWLAGDVGLWVRGFGESITVQFADVHVWEG
ncbi:MAG: hypothetical protein SXV54_04135 [Chloroflexota bacterium]|nr:hypothetical protein [Chloroflexota bacterium]